MKREDALYQQYLNILKEELRPAREGMKETDKTIPEIMLAEENALPCKVFIPPLFTFFSGFDIIKKIKKRNCFYAKENRYGKSKNSRRPVYLCKPGKA